MRILRMLVATLMFLLCVALFLDFTGVLSAYLGWVTRIQLVPAVLAINVVALIVIAALTLLFGRLYCSVICPLGIFQDIFAALRSKKSKYAYWKAPKAVRYGVLVVFVGLFIAGLGGLAAYVEPYGAFGRMANSLLGPIYDHANNMIAESAAEDTYDFYTVNIWIRGFGSLVAAIATFVVLAVVAFKTGRGYCNTVCPVGTFLGLLSKVSLFKIRINQDLCKGCKACANKCKGHCIDVANKTVDAERCVLCFDCLKQCKLGALSFGLKHKAQKASGASQVNQGVSEKAAKPEETVEESRRALLTAVVGGAVLLPGLAKAELAEGSLAPVSRKEPAKRQSLIVPPGAQSQPHFGRNCVGCMLCVRACHNQVLRTSVGGVVTLMQPTMSFERGWCRPSCNDCSTVCPTGAIKPISIEEKSSIQIGRAVWNKEVCLSAKGVHCSACVRACPNGALTLVSTEMDGTARMVPVVDHERCIGCGACEYVCAARPEAAIHVEGNLQHRDI